MTPFPTSAARPAYDALASTYDAFTADYDYERWLTVLHGLATEHGARDADFSTSPVAPAAASNRCCDAAMRSWPATSPQRWWSARQPASRTRAGAPRSPTCGDCRTGAHSTSSPAWTTPSTTSTSEVDLDAAFRSVARVLRPGGLYVFDVNSLTTYRTVFSSTFTVEADDGRLPLARGGVAGCRAALALRSAPGDLLGQLDLGHPSRSAPLAAPGHPRAPRARGPGVRGRAGSGHRRGPQRSGRRKRAHQGRLRGASQALRKDRLDGEEATVLIRP